MKGQYGHRGLNRLLSKLQWNEHCQRWGVMSRMVLRYDNGDVYLKRWRFIQTPLFGLYLHRIERPDADRGALHDHPWRFSAKTSFFAWIVNGGYMESIASQPGAEPVEVFRPRGIRAFPVGAVHRITEVLPNTWTVVFVGKRTNSWGFNPPGTDTIVPWKDYLTSQGRTPYGAAITPDIGLPDA